MIFLIFICKISYLNGDFLLNFRLIDYHSNDGRNFSMYCLKFDDNRETIWTKNYGGDTSNYFGYKKIVKTYNYNFAIGTVAGRNITRIGIIDSSGNIISTQIFH
ncbi:MAG: hypothetical protein ABI840_03680 [bacterium]